MVVIIVERSMLLNRKIHSIIANEASITDTLACRSTNILAQCCTFDRSSFTATSHARLVVVVARCGPSRLRLLMTGRSCLRVGRRTCLFVCGPFHMLVVVSVLLDSVAIQFVCGLTWEDERENRCVLKWMYVSVCTLVVRVCVHCEYCM